MSAASITRRRAMAALPAVGLAPTAALASPAAEEAPNTPILRLFAQWHSLHGRRLETDEESSALVDGMLALEKEMSEYPSTCLFDLAAKLAADTSYGDFGFNETISAELRSLTEEALGRIPSADSAEVDPHPTWLTEWREWDRRWNALLSRTSEDDEEQVAAEWKRLVTLIEETPTRTPRGAVAQVEFLLEYSSGEDILVARRPLVENLLQALRRGA